MWRKDRPHWAESGRAGQEIHDWLLSGQDGPFMGDGFSLSKVRRKIFSILYHPGPEIYGRKQEYKLAGIFNHGTEELTDVSEELCRILGESEPDVFRSKASVMPQLERAVNQRLLFYLDHRQGIFYALGREILPVVSREEVERQAAILLENGISSAEVYFRPDYTLEEMIGQLTDQVYLLYLEAGERVADAIARQYVKEKGAEMYRRKILYGCIQESLAGLECKRMRYLRRKDRQADA